VRARLQLSRKAVAVAEADRGASGGSHCRHLGGAARMLFAVAGSSVLARLQQPGRRPEPPAAMAPCKEIVSSPRADQGGRLSVWRV
jgi:hypothetical protein